MLRPEIKESLYGALSEIVIAELQAVLAPVNSEKSYCATFIGKWKFNLLMRATKLEYPNSPDATNPHNLIISIV